jgi:hypothetical protein
MSRSPPSSAVPAAVAIHPRWRKGRRRDSGRCRHPGHSDALAGGPEMGDRRYNVDPCVREGRSLLAGYVCCRWPPSRPTPTG